MDIGSVSEGPINGEEVSETRLSSVRRWRRWSSMASGRPQAKLLVNHRRDLVAERTRIQSDRHGSLRAYSAAMNSFFSLTAAPSRSTPPLYEREIDLLV